MVYISTEIHCWLKEGGEVWVGMLHTILVQGMKTLQLNHSIKLKKEHRWVE